MWEIDTNFRSNIANRMISKIIQNSRIQFVITAGVQKHRMVGGKTGQSNPFINCFLSFKYEIICPVERLTRDKMKKNETNLEIMACNDIFCSKIKNLFG